MHCVCASRSCRQGDFRSKFECFVKDSLLCDAYITRVYNEVAKNYPLTLLYCILPNNQNAKPSVVTHAGVGGSIQLFAVYSDSVKCNPIAYARKKTVSDCDPFLTCHKKLCAGTQSDRPNLHLNLANSRNDSAIHLPWRWQMLATCQRGMGIIRLFFHSVCSLSTVLSIGLLGTTGLATNAISMLFAFL